jgi:selenocysteine lyase/cysteine desulfurase
VLSASAATGMVLAELRRREFGRLDEHGQAYLDYGGSALYGSSQVRAHQDVLSRGLFGNPHSDSAPSRASTEAIEAARRRLLAFFDVDASTHVVCFTANASAALKLVAESYPFSPDRACVLSADNHNSVNGIREYARRAQAPVRYLPLAAEGEGEGGPSLRLREPEAALEELSARGLRGLLALPAQSNFSGVRHPLALVERAHARGFDVLLDVASYAPSHAFSLRACPADFAALSFYKLFGYPTGLGALVARREALGRLRRPWFAGGTVDYASVQVDTHRLRAGAPGFEDGTPDFLAVTALEPGFALLEEVGLPRLAEHVAGLTRLFLDELLALRHANGRPLVRVYGPRDLRERGGVVAFNVCDASGRALPYAAFEARARAAKVSVRGGCFCNPGAAEAAFGLEPGRMAACFEQSGDAFTVERFAACQGTAVGAVRVSLGLANNEEDVRRAVAVAASFR